MTDQQPTSILGVICAAECGKQGLTQENYSQQMDRPNRGWECPICGGSAEWDDERYDAGLEGTLALAEAASDQPTTGEPQRIMMKDLDWQDTPAPDHVQQARMYRIAVVEMNTLDDEYPDEHFYDPAIGIFYIRSGHRWLSAIQTFPHGEVRNA